MGDSALLGIEAAVQWLDVVVVTLQLTDSLCAGSAARQGSSSAAVDCRTCACACSVAVLPPFCSLGVSVCLCWRPYWCVLLLSFCGAAVQGGAAMQAFCRTSPTSCTCSAPCRRPWSRCLRARAAIGSARASCPQSCCARSEPRCSSRATRWYSATGSQRYRVASAPRVACPHSQAP